MLGVLYILTSRGGGATKKGPVCLSFIWTFSPFSKKKKMKTEKKSSRPYASFSNSMKYVARLQVAPDVGQTGIHEH